MQGRQGPGEKGREPLDRSATAGYRLSDLTGRQPVIPQRPRSMAHVDQPPPTPRVARPQREAVRVRRPRTWKWWASGAALLFCACVLIGVLAYGLTNLFFAVTLSSGSAKTAADFLSNLQSANYDQAYNDLDGTITVQLGRNSFKQLAQTDDRCYGPVTNYNEVDGSATSSSDGNTQSFAYSISRSKLAQPYQLRLTLHKDSAGDWSITSYGNDLGPATPTCK